MSGRRYEGENEMWEDLSNAYPGRTEFKISEVMQMEGISESTARRRYKFTNGRISKSLYIKSHFRRFK